MEGDSRDPDTEDSYNIQLQPIKWLQADMVDSFVT